MKYLSKFHANENQYREEMIELLVDHLLEAEDDETGERLAAQLLTNGCRGFVHLTTEELEQKLEAYHLEDLI